MSRSKLDEGEPVLIRLGDAGAHAGALRRSDPDLARVVAAGERASDLAGLRDVVVHLGRTLNAARELWNNVPALFGIHEHVQPEGDGRVLDHLFWTKVAPVAVTGITGYQIEITSLDVAEIGSTLAAARDRRGTAWDFYRMATRNTLRLLIREVFDCAAFLPPLPEEVDDALEVRAMVESGFKKVEIAKRNTLPAQDPETTRKAMQRRDVRPMLAPYELAARGMVERMAARAIEAAGGAGTTASSEVEALRSDLLDPDKTYVGQLARAWYMLHTSGFEIGAGDLDREPGPRFPGIAGSEELADHGLLEGAFVPV